MVSLMVALGILGGLSMVMMEMTRVGQQGIQSSIVKYDIHDHYMQLRHKLGDNEKCAEILAGQLEGNVDLNGIKIENFSNDAINLSLFEVGYKGKGFEFKDAETIWEEEGNITILMTYKIKGFKQTEKEIKKKMYVKLWWQSGDGPIDPLTNNTTPLNTSLSLVQCSSMYMGKRGVDDDRIRQILEAR